MSVESYEQPQKTLKAEASTPVALAGNIDKVIFDGQEQ